MRAVNKYYRKIAENVDNIKTSMEIASLLIKSQEVDLKIDEIIENLQDNLNLIDTNEDNIYHKGLFISANDSSLYGHKKRLDIIEKDIKNIPLNSTEIINIKNYNTDIIKILNIENDIVTINSNIKDIPNMKTSLDNVKYRQGVINIILDRLTPLQDIVKNYSTNITNNYNISQINTQKMRII